MSGWNISGDPSHARKNFRALQAARSAAKLRLHHSGVRIIRCSIRGSCQSSVEVMHPEIEVKLTASVTGCASCDLMAQLSREVNELDAADVLIRKVIDCRGAASLADSTHQALEVDVRVRIGEGDRACLNLSPATIEKMASISASLNFDPELTGDGGADELELEEESAPSTRPELVVVLVGESPVSGEEVILSRVERQQYRAGDIQGGVHEALQRGLERVEGEAKVWALEVGVRLSSQRGVWPGFNLSCDVIRLIASSGVSLDFDPYV